MMSDNSRQPVRLDSDKPAPSDSNPSLTRLERQRRQALTQIEEALQGLRFGQVTITVQDGVVVQIDRLERTRLQRHTD
jgi:hypothetical protein